MGGLGRDGGEGRGDTGVRDIVRAVGDELLRMARLAPDPARSTTAAPRRELASDGDAKSRQSSTQRVAPGVRARLELATRRQLAPNGRTRLLAPAAPAHRQLPS